MTRLGNWYLSGESFGKLSERFVKNYFNFNKKN